MEKEQNAVEVEAFGLEKINSFFRAYEKGVQK